MKYEDTICGKVNESIDLVRNIQRGEKIDLGKLAKTLRSVVLDAEHMEQALRERKAFMQQEGIEEKYQITKKTKKEEGKNDIKDTAEFRPAKDLHFEITVTDISKNKVIYQKKSYAAVMCTVEHIRNLFDADGVTHGDTQTFYFGNPLAWIFAFDQLRKSIVPHLIQVQEYVAKHYPEWVKRERVQQQAVNRALQMINKRN